MNKKWFPHIIAVTAFAVFIMLGLGSCASDKDTDENNGGNSNGNGGTTPTNRTITIKNNTGYTIGYGYGKGLWIKPSNSLDWGSAIGFDELSNGESRAYTLPARMTNNGIYDIRFRNGIYGNDGEYFTKHYVTVSNGMTLTFTQSDYNDGSQYPRITFKNLSGVDFDCYLKSSSTSDWVRLGYVGNNSSTTITLPILLENFNVFDIQMRSSSPTNTYTKNNVTVSNGMALTYFPTDSDNSSIIVPVIVIKNNTGYTIGYGYGKGLWIKPSNSLDWGSAIGFDELSNGESRAYTLPARITNNGIYDIRFLNGIYGINDSKYFTKYNVSLSFGMTLTFSSSDLE